MSKKISKKQLESEFQAFLRQSASSDDSFEISTHQKKPDPWWMDDSDPEDDGKIGKGKSFLKSKKPAAEKKTTEPSKTEKLQVDSTPKSKTTQEKAKPRNKLEVPPKRARNRTDVSMSKDSLEDISEKSEEHEPDGKRLPVLESNLDAHGESHTTDGFAEGPDQSTDPGKVGIDTMEENADKQRFFQDLEQAGTVDYSRLNHEMSRTEFGLSPGGDAGTAGGGGGVLEDLDEVPPSQKPEPANRPSLLSADKQDSSQAKPSMLSKVSLLDSLDSTLNTTTSPKASIPGDKPREGGTGEHLGGADMLKTRTGTGVGTNTSKEIEALHEALREVGMSTTYKPDGDILSLPQDAGTGDTGQNRGKERNIDDIFREMEELQNRENERDNSVDDIKLTSDYKSPRSPSSPSCDSKRLHRQSRMDDDHKQGGFDHSHTDDTEFYEPVTAVGDVRHLMSLRALQKKKDRKSRDNSRKSHDNSETTISSKPGNTRKSRAKPKFSHIQSSGYGRKSPASSPTRRSSQSPAKTRSQVQAWSPAHVLKQKIKGSEAPRSDHQPGQQIVDTQLMHSVESFAQYIKHHFVASDAPEVKLSKEEPSLCSRSAFDKLPGSEKEQVVRQELESVQQQLEEERQHSARLQENLSKIEESCQREIESLRREHEQELFKVKQENFVLQAKVSEGEPSELRGAPAGRDERLGLLEREVREQEGLLAGYQQENRRLYDDMRSLQKTSKLTEENMFKENQKLVTEITNLRSQLEQKDDQLRNKGVITSLAVQQQIAQGNSDTAVSAGKVAELETELKEAKRREDNLQREMKVLQKAKVELEQHIDQLVRERESLRKELDAARTAEPEQIKVLKAKHQEEVDQLKKKLKWYAENQELLDKSVRTIQEKDKTMLQLKARVEELQTEAGKRLEENKLRNKERAADAKKIRDYQRQIKEMEQILRRRHPNSLPALMMTAASVMEDENATKSPSIAVLEKQLRNLQRELENKDEQANTMLRAMEQKYNTVKLQFGERIADLEKQLAGTPPLAEHPHSHAVALERELDSVRERSKKEVAALHSQTEELTSELNKLKKNHHNLMKNDPSRPTEADLQNQVIQLQGELADKKHELQVLSVSLERLRREKHRYMMSGLAHVTGDATKLKGKSKTSKKKQEVTEMNGDIQNGFATFTAGEVSERPYEPNSFADTHLSDLLMENEHLKMKVDELQLTLDQQRVDLSKALAESEFLLRKNREEYEEQIEKLRSSHQNQVQKILTDHAFHHSTSRLAELHSKCDTQEVMIKHLQKQLAQCSVDSEQISVLKIQQVALQTQVERLTEKLREARTSHTPEMRHFEQIQEKVTQLEKRHQQREQELQQMIRNFQQVASVELQEEVSKWKNIVEMKNREIQKFRAELDSILDVLRVLQSQGVVLPVRSFHS